MGRTIHKDAETKKSVSFGRKVKRDKAISTKKKAESKGPTLVSPPLETTGCGTLKEVREGTIHRWMHTSGMIHVSDPSHRPFRIILHAFTKALVRNAHVFAANMGRKTIRVEDVAESLAVLDRKFYGKLSVE